MWSLLPDFVLKALGALLPFVLRRAYDSKRLAELVRVRIASDGDGIEYWGGELPFARVIVEITNLSPFPVEIERAFGAFGYGTQLPTFTYLKRHRIDPASELKISIQADMSPDQANYIRKNQTQKPSVYLYFNAYLLCDVNNIEIERQVTTTHCRLVNFNLPQ